MHAPRDLDSYLDMARIHLADAQELLSAAQSRLQHVSNSGRAVHGDDVAFLRTSFANAARQCQLSADCTRKAVP